MSYVSILGHQTWTSTGTEKDQTVLLLHGGLSNSDLMLDAIGGPLAERYHVATFDRRGHGRTADTSEPFHYRDHGGRDDRVLEYLGGPAHLVGWSDGGNVGLLVALQRPDLVGRLVLIGSNYHHDGLLPMPIDAAVPRSRVCRSTTASAHPTGLNTSARSSASRSRCLRQSRN